MQISWNTLKAMTQCRYWGMMHIKTAWGKLSNSTAPNIANVHLVKPVLAISVNNPMEEAQEIRFCLQDA
jgi:hypothetical protein